MEWDDGKSKRDKKRDWWDAGWEAENKVLNTSDKSEAARWRWLVENYESVKLYSQNLDKEAFVKYVDERRGVV